MDFRIIEHNLFALDQLTFPRVPRGHLPLHLLLCFQAPSFSILSWRECLFLNPRRKQGSQSKKLGQKEKLWSDTASQQQKMSKYKPNNTQVLSLHNKRIIFLETKLRQPLQIVAFVYILRSINCLCSNC